MSPRVVASACAVLLIVVGGATSCSSGGGDKGSSGVVGRTEASAPSTLPSSSSSTGQPSAPPGRPIAACATDVTRDDVAKAYWGMHVNFAAGSGFPRAPIGAVNLTTAGTYWNRVETAPGHYDFTRLDQIVATSHSRGAQPMELLGFTPSFHSQQPQSPAVAATMPVEAAWRAWVEAVVKRYGDRLDYQVWPEPNIVSNWSGTPEQMARLVVIAGDIIHARAPHAVVVAPAMALRLPSQQEWMSRFWATKVAGRPVADSVDAVAVDPFPLQDGTPADSLALLCQARAILQRGGVNLPLWTNEINYGVPSGGVAQAKAYPDARQAAWVGQTYVLHAALGIDRVYWLGWFSYPTLGISMARTGGAPTAAGRAFITVHDWLAGSPRPTCTVDKGLYTCLVNRGDTDLRILWRERGTASVTAVEGATRVEDLAGHTRSLAGGDLLQVGESPVAITAPVAS